MPVARVLAGGRGTEYDIQFRIRDSMAMASAAKIRTGLGRTATTYMAGNRALRKSSACPMRESGWRPLVDRLVAAFSCSFVEQALSD